MLKVNTHLGGCRYMLYPEYLAQNILMEILKEGNTLIDEKTVAVLMCRKFGSKLFQLAFVQGNGGGAFFVSQLVQGVAPRVNYGRMPVIGDIIAIFTHPVEACYIA